MIGPGLAKSKRRRFDAQGPVGYGLYLIRGQAHKERGNDALAEKDFAEANKLIKAKAKQSSATK